jgi:hypothetical protein
MSRTERNELKSVVKGQFKVLRREVEQRRGELLAEAYAEIERRTQEDEDLRAVVDFEVSEAVSECNRMINDILRAHNLMHEDGRERDFVDEPILWGRRYGGGGMNTKKVQLSQAAHLDLEAHVRNAMTKIDRQEADLLRDLAVGALESDEARAFLSTIPTVGELVPQVRMAEIEAALGDIEMDEGDDDGS